MTKYTAEIGGHSWARGPITGFRTVRAARQWAEEYGTTADYCVIRDTKGREIARHMRDTNGGGQWFAAEPHQ